MSSFGASSVKLILWSYSCLSGSFLNFFLLNKCVNSWTYFGRILSVTLKIGLFHLLVTNCFMCHVVIVGRYKYKWLRRDSLHVCNKFPLLSYILLTQHISEDLQDLLDWVLCFLLSIILLLLVVVSLTIG